MKAILSAAAVVALTGSVNAAFVDLNFNSNPTIEGGAPGMSVQPNGSITGNAIDGSDRVRYSNVGMFNGMGIDAIMTVVDAQNRTRINFSGGGTTVDSIFNTVNDAVINLSNAGGNDTETGNSLIAGPSSQLQRTSSLIRIDLVHSGTTNLIDANLDIGLTFFDIDGASSGPHRGRVDGITLLGADQVFLAGNTVLELDNSVAGEVTATPTTGFSQSPQGEAERYAVTGLWSGVNSLAFEWFFDWSANGTRGVNFNGNSTAFVPAPGAAALVGVAGLAAVRRRREL